MRLIDADALEREGWKLYLNYQQDKNTMIYETKSIQEIPTAQPEQQWIPCSERLPEKAGKYLVSVRNGNVYAGIFDKYSGKFQCAAIAWMPLPEAYKEAEE